MDQSDQPLENRSQPFQDEHATSMPIDGPSNEPDISYLQTLAEVESVVPRQNSQALADGPIISLEANEPAIELDADQTIIKSLSLRRNSQALADESVIPQEGALALPNEPAISQESGNPAIELDADQTIINSLSLRRNSQALADESIIPQEADETTGNLLSDTSPRTPAIQQLPINEQKTSELNAAPDAEQAEAESIITHSVRGNGSMPASAIPHRPRPRAVPTALSSTLHTLREWTGQMQAIGHKLPLQPKKTPEMSDQAPTQILPEARYEPFIQASTQTLPGTGQPPGNQVMPRPQPPALIDSQVPAPLTPPRVPGTLRPPNKRTERWRRPLARRASWVIRQRRERKNARLRKSKRLGITLFSVFASLLLVLLSSGAGYIYAYYQNQQPRLQSLANQQIDQSTHIFDRSGNLLYTLYDSSGRSTPVSYKSIPGVMQDAMTAAEDPTFWTNDGVDPQGVLRAFSQYASAGGEFQSGGSTITQQLIKNLDNQLYHETEETFQRKVSEGALAIGLTQEYPKWKILEMYFNISAFGAQEEGVEAATEDFFGLKPQCDAHFNCIPAVAFLDRDLTQCTVTKPKIDESTCKEDPLLGLARASFLAGMPQNPVIYDPTVFPLNIPYALQRQDYVLQQMLADKMQINLGLGDQVHYAEPITPKIIKQVEALTKNIKFIGFQNTEIAPDFVSWIIQTMANDLGNDQDLVNGTSVPGMHILNSAGLNIQTTIDLNLETYTRNAINRHINQPEYQEYLGYSEILSRDDSLHDSSAVVMDAKTGEVLALVGSANWNDTTTAGSGQINMALTPRQPGSSFKSIALAAAYQEGFYPGIVLPDYQTFFPTTSNQSAPVSTSNTYAPPDYGGKWHDQPFTIETSISNSFNIPALKIEYYAGLQNVYDMAARLGITSIDPKTGLVPSMTLGTEPVSLLQMVDAYQTFADQGLHIQSQGILNIWDNYGHQLYHFDPNATRVLSQDVAFLVTSTLDNQQARQIEFPGDTLLTMNHWTLADGTHPQVAAKTGTTDSFKDNWTIGYTPDVVVGVWSGNADDSAMVNSIGITGAAPIWDSLIYYASGYCNKAYDGISCPTYDLGQVVGTTRTFSIPDGIVQQEVNTSNGLAGSGYDSYMINGEQPVQNGYGH